MEDTKKYVSEICALKEKLICGFKEQLNRGMHNVNTEEAGQVTDMIKDLAEAEEKCWKACYYKHIVEAMKEEEEEEELMMKLGVEGGDESMGYRRGSRRMGYDHWRFSSGRFAPTGHGHYSAGYRPMEGDMHDMDPYMMPQWGDAMGYSGGSRSGGQNGSSGSSYGGGTAGGSRMGYTPSERGHRYDAYNKARMGFHESRDAQSKEHMDAAAKEYVIDITEAVRDVWKDADPSMRKEIKNKFSALMSEMN